MILMCIYNTGSRAGLLEELKKVKTQLTKNERKLLNHTNSVIDKLNYMSDNEFDNITINIVTIFKAVYNNLIDLISPLEYNFTKLIIFVKTYYNRGDIRC